MDLASFFVFLLTFNVILHVADALPSSVPPAENTPISGSTSSGLNQIRNSANEALLPLGLEARRSRVRRPYVTFLPGMTTGVPPPDPGMNLHPPTPVTQYSFQFFSAPISVRLLPTQSHGIAPPLPIDPDGSFARVQENIRVLRYGYNDRAQEWTDFRTHSNRFMIFQQHVSNITRLLHYDLSKIRFPDGCGISVQHRITYVDRWQNIPNNPTMSPADEQRFWDDAQGDIDAIWHKIGQMLHTIIIQGGFEISLSNSVVAFVPLHLPRIPRWTLMPYTRSEVHLMFFAIGMDVLTQYFNRDTLPFIHRNDLSTAMLIAIDELVPVSEAFYTAMLRTQINWNPVWRGEIS